MVVHRNIVALFGLAACSTGGILVNLPNEAAAAACTVNSATPCFSGVGSLSAFQYGFAYGVSRDGHTVVGNSYLDSGTARAFIWVDGVMSELMCNPGDFSNLASAANADGSITSGVCNGVQLRWINGAKTPPLGTLPNGFLGGDAVGLSDDGSVVVGRTLNSSSQYEAYRWTAGGGMQGLGVLTGSFMSGALAVSANGSIVAGTSTDASAGVKAFRWANGTMTDLGYLPGATGTVTAAAMAITADGSQIFGYSTNAKHRIEAFRWTNGTMVGLRTGPGTCDDQCDSAIRIVNADGTVAFGTCGGGVLCRWTTAKGWELLTDVFAANGVSTGDWFIGGGITGVSADGTFVVGWGTHPGATEGWVAKLALPKPTVAHDFNSSSNSDLLWRASTGDVAMWFMNGTALQSGAGVGAIDPNWQIVKMPTGTGDFNGDGKADILWHHTNGSVALWLMNGSTVAAGAGLGAIDPSWQIAGVGDFNGDGKADILWRNTSGALSIWFMNGTTIAFSAGVASLTPTWQVAAIADLNGDGKADIVLRNTTSGDVAVWLMDGATIASGAGLGILPSAWQIVGTGDFDADGKADILWRHSSGSLAMWFMNGTTIGSAASVGAIDPAWSVASTGDYDGNGKTDILWRSTGGDVAMWLMNGASIASGAGLGVLPAAWSIVE